MTVVLQLSAQIEKNLNSFFLQNHLVSTHVEEKENSGVVQRYSFSGVECGH